MAVLVAVSPLDGEPYFDALSRIPGLTVWREDENPPPEQVEAILAWRLKDGTVGRYPNLRLVAAIGAGVDKIVRATDLPPGLAITRTVDPNQGMEIAQYVVAQALRVTRDLNTYAQQQARGEWRRHAVRPPSACRVGILGIGQVGQAIARAFRPLGYPVAGWSRRAHDIDGVACFAGDSQLGALLARSDILVCALPLTPATRGLMDRALLSQLPRGAMVINIGRGEQLVEEDLRALLDEGHLSAAALDVFEREPLPAGHWIWSHPKVAATPHIAAQASYDEVARQLADNLTRLRRGERPRHEVDRSAGY